MESQLQVAAAKPTSEQLKLLLVDDDPEDLFFLKRLLVKSGIEHDVMVANSVDQAFEKLDETPDVVLLDYCLGDQTGFDLLSRMQKSGCNLPVIMLTGFEDSELDLLALNSGVADFLPKRHVNPVMLNRSIRYAHRDYMRLQQLEYLAHFDTLTGLCNRRLFMDRLEHAFEGCKRHEHTGALLYIDIDGFKDINDAMGHSIGDELLKIVAERMIGIVRAADTVARLGGDEFVILLEQVSGAQAHLVAQKLLRMMEEPVRLQQQCIDCSLSIGLCVFGAHSQSPHEILTSADRALYQAKMLGKHTYCSFNRNLMKRLSRKLLLEQLAQQTVTEGDFDLFYQPRFDAGGIHVLGFEALARWPRREELELTPDEFIPVLENMGLMDQFTSRVISKALQDMKQLQGWVADCRLSINVSPSNFARMNLVDYMRQQVAEHGIAPDRIELEVTENVFIEQPVSAIQILTELRKMGFRIALDDFGTGYSSLSCLNQLPIDTIKLDRKFLERVPESERSSLLVRAIVDLACNLELNVVAEGVENLTQMLFMQSCGCHELQGYLTGRPMALDKLESFLTAQPTWSR